MSWVMKVTCKHSEEAYLVGEDGIKSGQWVWRCFNCHLKHIEYEDRKQEYIKRLIRETYYEF